MWLLWAEVLYSRLQDLKALTIKEINKITQVIRCIDVLHEKLKKLLFIYLTKK